MLSFRINHFLLVFALCAVCLCSRTEACHAVTANLVWSANNTVFSIPIAECGIITNIVIQGPSNFPPRLFSFDANYLNITPTSHIVIPGPLFLNVTYKITESEPEQYAILQPGQIVPYLARIENIKHVNEHWIIEGIGLGSRDTDVSVTLNVINPHTSQVVKPSVSSIYNGVSLEFLPPSHMTYGDVWATVTVDQLDSNTEYVGKAYPVILASENNYVPASASTFTVKGRSFAKGSSPSDLRLSDGVTGRVYMLSDDTLEVSLDYQLRSPAYIRMEVLIDGYTTCLSCNSTLNNAPVVAHIYPEISPSLAVPVEPFATVEFRGFGLRAEPSENVTLTLDKGAACTSLQSLSDTMITCTLSSLQCGRIRATSLSVNNIADPLLTSNPIPILEIKPVISMSAVPTLPTAAGVKLTITGNGFGFDQSLISVVLTDINNQHFDCIVESLTHNKIVCLPQFNVTEPGDITAIVSCGGAKSDPQVAMHAFVPEFDVDASNAMLHTKAARFVFTGQKFGVSAPVSVDVISISNVISPAGVSATVVFAERSIALAEVANLTPGNLVITVVEGKPVLPKSKQVQVAVISDSFSISGGVNSNDDEIHVSSVDITITGSGFEPHCKYMIGRIRIGDNSWTCLTGYYECNDTYAICHIIDTNPLDPGDVILVLEKGGLAFKDTRVAIAVPSPVVLPSNQIVGIKSKRITFEATGTAPTISREDILLYSNVNGLISFNLVNYTYGNTTLIECEILDPLPLGSVIAARVARLGVFSEAVNISSPAADSPIVLTSMAKRSLAATTLTINGLNFGDSLRDLIVELYPSGYCDMGDLTKDGAVDVLTLINCSDLSEGYLYAVVEQLRMGISEQTVIYEIVPAATIYSTNQVYRATKSSQIVDITGNFVKDDVEVLEMQITSASSSAELNCIKIPVTDSGVIRCEVEMRKSGNIFVRILEKGGWTHWTQIGSVFSPPIISQRGLVATSATFLKIRGLNFDPDNFPLVLLRFWDGPAGVTYEYIDQSLEFNSYYVDCIIEGWTTSVIQCRINNPLPSYQTGVYWAQITSYGYTTPPTVVADLVPPPMLQTSSIPLARSARYLELLGIGFDPDLADVEITLKDSSSTLMPCEVVLEAMVANVRMICEANFTRLSYGPLMVQMVSYGATTEWIQAATIVAAPVVDLPNKVANIAASVRTLTVRGTNFATSEVESDSQGSSNNRIHFLLLPNATASPAAGIAFECQTITVVSSSELVCHMPSVLDDSSKTGGQLYMAVSANGGFAYGGGLPSDNSRRRKRDMQDEVPSEAWHLVGVITPPPVITRPTGEPELISVNTALLTIHGENFDGSGETLGVVFSPIGSTTPKCTIKSATDKEVVCELSDLVEGTLMAVVYSFQGPSEAVDVAIVTPDNRLQIGLGVGIPTFLLVCAAIILVSILVYRTYRRKRLMAMFSQKASHFREKMGETAYSHQMSEVDHEDRIAQEALSPWKIEKENVEFIKEIGQGSFGKVWIGRWNKKRVAIKETKLASPQARAEFYREVQLMLGMEPHRNVVRTYGVIIDNAEHTFWIVMEHLAGSLDKIVYNPSNHAQLSEDEMIGFARGIAQGMAHLAKLKIVHRDLAVRNVLLSKDSTAKISDFGMSRVLGSELEGQTASTVGPIFWMSPEALMQRFSEKSDVWAYGVTLWEIVTGKEPYEGRDKLEVAIQVRDHGMTLPMPEKSPKILATIMKRCWKYDPSERPTFAEICNMLGVAPTSE